MIRQTETERGTEKDTQSDRQTDKERERQNEKERETEKETHTHSDKKSEEEDIRVVRDTERKRKKKTDNLERAKEADTCIEIERDYLVDIEEDVMRLSTKVSVTFNAADNLWSVTKYAVNTQINTNNFIVNNIWFPNMHKFPLHESI